MLKQAIDWKKISVNQITNKGILSRLYKEFSNFNSKNEYMNK